MKLAVVALLLALVSFSACDDAAVQPASPAPSDVGSPSDPGRQNSACANEDTVVEDRDTQEGTTRSVDVDGDGRADEVRLHLDFEAAVGCQAFLVVVTRSGSIVEPVWTSGPEGGLPQPSLYAFTDLDGDGGYEILINEASGASTQFVGAYALTNDDLVSIEAPKIEGGLFPFGGSVGHIEAVDCRGDGEVVVSQALPSDRPDALEKNLYEITRRTYDLERGVLESVEVERVEVSIEDLNRFPEFSAGPFGSCPAP